ncbi:MAG: hypothetical protein IK013_03675 [Bacteroidales bacterium]|nr:hypothetical protein [Bacteroidales bacterium]
MFISTYNYLIIKNIVNITGNFEVKKKANFVKTTKKLYFCTSKGKAMASFESLYNKIEYNVKSAILRMAELRKENDTLREEVELLRQQQQGLRKQLADMEEKIKLTIITKTILDKEDKKETKRQIQDWVREIDNCITLLTSK